LAEGCIAPEAVKTLECSWRRQTDCPTVFFMSQTNNFRRARGGGKSSKSRGQALTLAQKQAVRQIAKGVTRGEEEVKYFPFGFVTISAVATGFVVPMSQITQGATATTRVGESVRPKHFKFQYKIIASANTVIASADQYNITRVIFFRWHDDSTTALPVLADILVNNVDADFTLANYNRDQATRYTILYDRCHVLVNTPVWNGTTVLYEVGPGSVGCVESSIKLRGSMNFRGAAITGTEQVFMLIVSDSSFTPHPQIDCQCETSYTDG